MRIFIFKLLLILTSSSFAADESQDVDSFGAIDCKDEIAHLDKFSIELQKAGQALGYILIYGGRRDTKRDEMQIRGARMKRYLVENRGLNTERILVLGGGYREHFAVELWLAPPLASPTVDKKDVRFKKGKMGRYQEPGCFPGKYLIRKERPA